MELETLARPLLSEMSRDQSVCSTALHAPRLWMLQQHQCLRLAAKHGFRKSLRLPAARCYWSPF